MDENIQDQEQSGLSEESKVLADKFGVDLEKKDENKPEETKTDPDNGGESDKSENKDTATTPENQDGGAKTPPEKTDNSQPKKKYAGAFDSIEELEKAYKETSGKGIEMATEINQLKEIATAGAVLAQQLKDDPELFKAYQEKYGKKAAEEARDNTQGQEIMEIVKDPKKFEEFLDNRDKLKEEERQKSQAFEEEKKNLFEAASKFEAAHPEVTFDETVRGRIGALRKGFKNVFPDETEEQLLERAYLQLFPDAAIDQRAKEKAAQNRNNSVASSGAGGSGAQASDANIQEYVEKLSPRERSLAQSFGITEEAYAKRKYNLA